jgi:hypothetical protein
MAIRPYTPEMKRQLAECFRRERQRRIAYCKGLDADLLAAILEVHICLNESDVLKRLTWAEYTVLCRSRHFQRVKVYEDDERKYRSNYFMGYKVSPPAGSPPWMEDNHVDRNDTMLDASPRVITSSVTCIDAMAVV